MTNDTGTNIENKIEKINSTNIVNEKIPCVQIMDKVFKGDVWLLPFFAQSLISFLYEDMPQNTNPRVMAHHVATKGAYVLSEAMKMSKEQEVEEQKIKEQQERIKFVQQEDPVLLIGLSFACGSFFQSAEYIKCLLCATYIFKTSQFHKNIKDVFFVNALICLTFAYTYYFY